jgi:hypothetical protein
VVEGRGRSYTRGMGTGTITLWWYALCCAFVTLSVIATSILIAVGQRRRRAKAPKSRHDDNRD